MRGGPGSGAGVLDIEGHGGPKLFAEAVEIDGRMRGGLAFAKKSYLYMLRIPLDEAVALDEASPGGADSEAGSGTSVTGTVVFDIVRDCCAEAFLPRGS